MKISFSILFQDQQRNSVVRQEWRAKIRSMSGITFMGMFTSGVFSLYANSKPRKCKKLDFFETLIFSDRKKSAASAPCWSSPSWTLRSKSGSPRLTAFISSLSCRRLFEIFKIDKLKLFFAENVHEFWCAIHPPGHIHLRPKRGQGHVQGKLTFIYLEARNFEWIFYTLILNLESIGIREILQNVILDFLSQFDYSVLMSSNFQRDPRNKVCRIFLGNNGLDGVEVRHDGLADATRHPSDAFRLCR